MEDLISRQAVIDLFAERLNGWTLEEAIPIVDRFVNEREHCDDVWHAVVTIRDIAECVKQDVEKYLPSADRPRGKWESKEVLSNADGEVIEEWQSARCSNCGRYHTTPYMYYFNKYNYCPNCGADMRGEQE